MNLMSELDASQYQEKYKLNDEQKERYREMVISFFTTGKSPSPGENTPTLVFAGGQTGCGKKQLIKLLKEENQNQVIYSVERRKPKSGHIFI